MFKKKRNIHNLTKSITVVIGVVLVWRGTWYSLDLVDKWLFDGNHFWTAQIGIIAGLLILYLPDKDLKEIGK